MDFGLGPILTREGARNKDNIKKYLEYTLGLKSILIIVSAAALIVAINLLGSLKNFETYDIYLVYAACLIIILDTLTFTFYSVYRALQKMKYEAIGILCYQIVIALAGYLILSSGHRSMGALAALLTGSAVNFLYSSYLVFLKGKIRPKIRFNWKKFKTLLKISAPFALAGIFFKLNGSIDSVMLKSIAGDRFVGWYSVAFKMTTALTVLPGAFATSFFPAMSYYFEHDKEKLKYIFEKAFAYLTILSLPIATGTIMIANDLIIKIYTEAFEASIFALQIFMLGLFFIFVNYPIGNLLNAANRQTLNTINMGIALLLNIGLNIILIPKYTYIGAAFAALCSSVFLVILGLPWVYKIIKFNIKNLLLKFLQAIFSSLAMITVIYYLQDSISLIYLIISATVTYSLCIFLVKGVSFGEIKELSKSVLKK